MTAGETSHGNSGIGEAQTSFHVRQARQGVRESLDWVVARFSPLLLAQARYRLGKLPSPPCEAGDLVGDVWGVALEKLPDLDPADRRATPMLLRFLGTTLLHLYSNLVRKSIRRGQMKASAPTGLASGADAFDLLRNRAQGVVSTIIRAEAEAELSSALADLQDLDREIVVLRAIEQSPTASVASQLRLTPKAVSLRYNRALARLRKRLQGSVFAELEPDSDPEEDSPSPRFS